MKKLTRFAAFMLSVAMLASVTGCDLPFGGDDSKGKKGGSKEENAVTDAVAGYMDNVIGGKYDKAVKSVAEQDDEDAINISTMFDYLSDDQADVIEALISTTEYEVTDVEVDDDEAKCKLVLTVVDIESVIDDMDDGYDIDDLIDAIEDSDDTTEGKIKLSLVNDDDWMLESDEDIANFYFEMVEDIAGGAASGVIDLTNADFSEESVLAYIDNCFATWATGDFSEFNDGEAGEVFAGINSDSPEFVGFLSTYFSNVTHSAVVNSIDVDNKTANVTINTTVPNAGELVGAVYQNHDLLVRMFAYSISGQDADFDNNPELASMFIQSMTNAIPTASKENLSTTTTVAVDEDGNYGVGENASECLFGSTENAAQPNMTDEETMALMMEAIEYAHDNNMITDAEYEQYVAAFSGAAAGDTGAGTGEVPAAGNVVVDNVPVDYPAIDSISWPEADEESYGDVNLTYFEGEELYLVESDVVDANSIGLYFVTWDLYDTGKTFIYKVVGPNVDENADTFAIVATEDYQDEYYISYSPVGGVVSGTYQFLVIDADDNSVLTAIYYEVA